MYHLDWRIYAYDAASHKTRLLADSDQLYRTKQLPWPPGYVEPVLSSDGIVYWSALAPDRTGRQGFTPVILARDLAGRTPVRTVVRNAVYPRVAGSTLYYVKSNASDPKTAAGRFEIHARTGPRDTIAVEGPLVRDQQIGDLAVNATHVAWTVGVTSRQADPSTDPDQGCADRSANGCTLNIKRVGTDTIRRIALSGGGADLAMHDTLLGWGSGSAQGDPGEYLFDLERSKLYRLGRSRGCSTVWIAGGYIAWWKVDATGNCGITVARWTPPS